MVSLKDPLGRQFTYLRLSVTDVCNFRCVYCLPQGYRKPAEAPRQLTLAEIRNLVSGFAELGIEKVRLTGGEPTVREDIVEVVSAIAKVRGIKTVALTTNGFRLSKLARPLQAAGLSSLNVSVDSLDSKRFAAITGQDRLDEILEGIEAAKSAGIQKIKLNSVLLKDLTERDLDGFLDFVKSNSLSVRFIELMQTRDNDRFFKEHHLSAGQIQLRLGRAGWRLAPRNPNDGPAVEYVHPDFAGRIGLIAPYSKEFCKSCNRLRVTSTGQLRLCLFGEDDYSLRTHLKDESQKSDLQETIVRLLEQKRRSHLLDQGIYGNTSNLAAIGG